jgi:hypothetical protein
METQVSKETTELEKVKSVAEQKFEMTINEANAAVNQCKSISITDSTTLSMAEQALSRAAKMLKIADEKRKEMNKPFSERIAVINEVVKSKITTPLEESIAFGKTQLKKYNDEEKARKAAVDEKNQKDLDFLKGINIQLTEKIKLDTTPEACRSRIESIKKNWPADEKFGAYAEEATKTKNNFITFLTTRAMALEVAAIGGEGSIDKVVESVEAQEAAMANQSVVVAEIDDKKEVLDSNNTASKSKTRKTYKFEIIDPTKLPMNFLSPDPVKIREYMNANKDKVTYEGFVIGSVRFYISDEPVIS